jgi:hypothetical protein
VHFGKSVKLIAIGRVPQLRQVEDLAIDHEG